MKTTIKRAAIFFALLMAVACSPDNPTPEPEPEPPTPEQPEPPDDDDGYVAGTGTGTYISEFVENNTFRVSTGAQLAQPFGIITVSSGGHGYPGLGNLSGFTLTIYGDKYISANHNSAEYNQLREKLRDNTSPLERNGECEDNTWVSHRNADYDGIPAITNRITGLTITAEPQYTSTIPVGEPINEVFNLLYSDMAGFVWKGYERPEESFYTYLSYRPSIDKDDNLGYIGWTDLPTYYKLVSADNKEAYCIDYIGQDIILYINTPPDNLDIEYDFTFTMEFADGTSVTKQVTYDGGWYWDIH
jgi:hypothetical protein